MKAKRKGKTGKRVAVIVFIKGTTLLGACGDTKAVSNQGEHDSQEEAEKTSKSVDDTSGEEEQEKKTKEKPFKPIEPPEDAQPLEDKYSEEDKENTSDAEVYNDESERSVPLGETLLKGKEDLSDGPLKDHRLVAFYGTPLSENMGILGEYSPEEMMEKLKEQTEAYSKADPKRPAVPTIELIATVAQRTPGPEGLYVSKPKTEIIETYAKLAEENDALLLLDIQLGQGTVMDEVKAIEPYLKLPYVHLAIDTEYSVEEGQIPGEDLGEVDGKDVQEAVEYVDKMVQENDLPDKMVLVHQFGNDIVTNKDKIKPTEHVQVPLNYDGFGDPDIKISAYGKLVRDQPIQYGGFKLFYDNDDPLLTPEEVLQLDPAPAIVNYQ